MTDLLSLDGISKSFSGVTVLDGIDLTVPAGSITALVGENGAGKSTMMKIISGIYARDAGQMRLRGREVTFTSPKQAMDAGIAIIHQELNLLPELTVAQNIFLGREPLNRCGLIDRRAMNAAAKALLDKLCPDIAPTRRLGGLSIARQQMVEIAKALAVDADVIILDEPTDALTDAEAETLFAVMNELKAQGKGLVFISHRLGEVFRMCDRIAVLRDGNMVHRGPTAEIDEATLIRHMVGRELSEQYPYAAVAPGPVRLKVDALQAIGVEKVTFAARAGEVIGFAGLMGAGRTELAKALFGANPARGGRIEIDGVERRIRKPADGVKAGIGYVTEDRKAEGLVQMHGVRPNMVLTGLGKFTTALGTIDRRAEAVTVRDFIKKFGIKTDHMDKQVSLLSGGNQQKVTIAKALIPDPEIVILDEPTRGVDVGAKREIYAAIQALKEQGLCILLMSSDIPELLGISDRILVMAQGRITGELGRNDANQEAIMRAAVH